METTETQILTPAPKINLENVSLKKIAPICKRTINHINIENFCELIFGAGVRICVSVVSMIIL
jgi:hypothetical protein